MTDNKLENYESDSTSINGRDVKENLREMSNVFDIHKKRKESMQRQMASDLAGDRMKLPDALLIAAEYAVIIGIPALIVFIAVGMW